MITTIFNLKQNTIDSGSFQILYTFLLRRHETLERAQRIIKRCNKIMEAVATSPRQILTQYMFREKCMQNTLFN